MTPYRAFELSWHAIWHAILRTDRDAFERTIANWR